MINNLKYKIAVFCLVLSMALMNYFVTVPQEPAKADAKSCTSEGCHPDKIKFKTVHSPAQDDCSTCHNQDKPDHPSGNGKEFSETKAVPELCSDCHDISVKGSKHTHSPVQDGDCLSCHNPHGSDIKPLLNTNDGKLICSTCHDMFDTDSVIHDPVKKQECLKCHQPHYSKESHLLRDGESNLCLSCHNKVIKTKTGKIENIKAKINSKNVHPPVTSGCTDCHNPHTSKNHSLLNDAFPSGFYDKGTAETFSLCFKCHDKELLTSPDTKNTGFRNDSKNLHYIHSFGDKGRNCTVCHDIHGSTGEHLIIDKKPFGSWMINMNYVAIDNGGTCSPGCHESKTYYRDPGALALKSAPKLDRKPLKSIPGQSGKDDDIVVSDGKISGKINVTSDIPKQSVEDMNIHVVSKDSAINKTVKVGKDLSFSVKDLPPGDYSITFDTEDLDYIDAQPVIPEIKFSVMNKSDSSVKTIKPISLELKKSDQAPKAKSQTKIIVKPNQIRKVKYSDPGKLMEKKESKVLFASYLKYLKSHRKAKLNIIVHTDDIGDILELQKQSQETAQRIAQYFISKGISRDRLLTRGMGPIEPIASNKTKAGRAKNKRIELKIIK